MNHACGGRVRIYCGRAPESPRLPLCMVHDLHRKPLVDNLVEVPPWKGLPRRRPTRFYWKSRR